MNTGSYVNGKWYRPASSGTTKNINPADTSDVIAEYPLATAADVRLAIEAAEAACCGAPLTLPAGASTKSPAR